MSAHTDVPVQPRDEDAQDGRRVAMRVVFPVDGDLDVIPVYVDGGRKSKPSELRPGDILDRRRIRVRPDKRVSLGSYFNAFPGGYWRNWTLVESVRLQVSTSGPGQVIVYKSNAKGVAQRVESREVEGESTQVIELSLKTFGDGGFYWFDLVAGAKALVLEGAHWSVDGHNRPRSKVTLGVTTFNRSDYCVRTIGMVAGDTGLREILDEMLVIDQGTQKVADEEGFDEVAQAMGSQLQMIEQPNLGGSGGFSRCMYETAQAGRAEYVILLDDDIILEPESIVRLVTFADLCRRPTIVGGHMFDMYNRDTLHAYGEVVNPFNWHYGLPSPKHYLEHSFKRTGLRHTAWMHQRVDVDYNGWWMCLIPVSVIREIGLSLPIFIKWDDAEYALRAKEKGIPTVSLPGACLWHVSWGDKDDLVGWQAYFHARNRLITAVMYSPFDHGAQMLRTAYFLDLKHVVAMQYYTGAGRAMALQDFLAGPEKLHEILPRRLAEIRAMAADFPDAVVKTDVDAFPPPWRRKPIKPEKPRPKKKPGPGRPALMVKGAKAVARQLFLPVDERSQEHPQERIAHKDAIWYRVARNDSAVVSVAEGTGASWYQRDPQVSRQMAKDSTLVYGRIFKDWGRLREEYRAARDQITSFAAWEKTFGLSRSDE